MAGAREIRELCRVPGGTSYWSACWADNAGVVAAAGADISVVGRVDDLPHEVMRPFSGEISTASSPRMIWRIMCRRREDPCWH